MTSSPTNPSSPARLIVCEGSGQWSAALRGELAEAGVRLWECRSLPEAWDALAQTPAAFVIVEATEENLESLLRRMTWSSRDFPQARIAVVAQRNMARCEWLLREAGAVHFLTLPRRLAPLAGLVVRHLANVPPPSHTFLERIWASLPWGPPDR
jgi:DNA-binding NtrC family response regulator